MEQKLKSGIYQILNEINGESYIGSSVNIIERWQRHRKDLKGNRHHSRFLQRAYNKYGVENFKYLVLEFCEKNILAERENYYLDCLKPIYNICPKAYNQVGKKLTEEHKEKLKLYAIKNNIKPPESTYEKIRKKIIMLDKKTENEIRRFNSISEACFFIGKTHKFVNTLSKVCNGKRKSAFGFKWRFV